MQSNFQFHSITSCYGPTEVSFQTEENYILALQKRTYKNSQFFSSGVKVTDNIFQKELKSKYMYFPPQHSLGQQKRTG